MINRNLKTYHVLEFGLSTSLGSFHVNCLKESCFDAAFMPKLVLGFGFWKMSKITDFGFELWRISAGESGRSLGRRFVKLDYEMLTHELGYDCTQIILDGRRRKQFRP